MVRNAACLLSTCHLDALVEPSLGLAYVTANYDNATFADAEASCQQQCAHLVTFSSLQEQVGAWPPPAGA